MLTDKIISLLTMSCISCIMIEWKEGVYRGEYKCVGHYQERH